MKSYLSQNEKLIKFYSCFLGEKGKDYVLNNPTSANINVEKFFEEMIKLTSDREMYILRKRFGINCEESTLYELGIEYNISCERVRQIEARTIRKLKHPSILRFVYTLLLDAEPKIEEIKDIEIPKDLSKLLIEDIPFSIRTCNVLKRSNIITLKDLVNINIYQLKKIKNIGKRNVKEIVEFLIKYNLSLSSEI